MNHAALPYVVEPAALQAAIGSNKLHILCLAKQQIYLEGHIAGAVWLDIAKLNDGEKPVSGLLPTAAQLTQTFAAAGLNQNDHVVCYDEDAGTKAARAVWVLEAMGHKSVSFVNGGLDAWHGAGLPLDLPLKSGDNTPTVGNWRAAINPAVIADKLAVLQSLDNAAIQILDARTLDEYQGLKSASLRMGHIPGAIHLNWLDTIDHDNHHRLKSPAVLRAMLAERGIRADREIIAHCQTHQRSSHSFVMLRSLGYNKVRGFAGAWAEWSADPNMPIAHTLE